MIASAHSADKKVFEISRLSEEVKELKSMMSDKKTKHTNLKMESTIVKKVQEKGLEVSKTPPKKIIIKSQN